MSKSSSQYVGLDVSLKETSICVIDDAGKIVWRGRTGSTPEAIASAVKRHAPHAVRISLRRISRRNAVPAGTGLDDRAILRGPLV